MNAILTEETIDILSGQKNMDSDSEETAHFETSHRETWFGRFKKKVRKVWTGILDVAEDIREKIIPVIEPIGKVASSLIMAIAVFRRSKRGHVVGRAV